MWEPQVLFDFMPSIEADGFRIRAGVLRLWEGERRREALVAGLDEPAQKLMGLLLDRLAVEDGSAEPPSSDDEEEEDVEDDIRRKMREESRTAAFLALGDGAPGGDKTKERLINFLEMLPFFSRGFANMRAALEGIFAGQRDARALCSGLGKAQTVFVRMVLRAMDERGGGAAALEALGRDVEGHEKYEAMRR